MNNQEVTKCSNTLASNSPLVITPIGFKFNYTKLKESRDNLLKDKALNELGIEIL